MVGTALPAYRQAGVVALICFVIPAKPGIHIYWMVPCFRRACPVLDTGDRAWIPVFTGMTDWGRRKFLWQR
jgi:hypothetical protein